MTTITRSYEGIQTTYNRSAIMKLAHEIKNAAKCSMSEALRKAWKAAKAAQKQAVSEATYNNDTVTVTVSFWAKYGKIRGYMNAVKTNPNDKRAKTIDCNKYINFAA